MKRQVAKAIKEAKKRSVLKKYCIEHEQCRGCKYQVDGRCVFEPSPYSWSECNDILVKQESIPELTSL